MADKKLLMPLWQKPLLTVEETSVYSNIGVAALRSHIKDPRCPFVIYVGKKALIKRKEFEKYISDAIEF